MNEGLGLRFRPRPVRTAGRVAAVSDNVIQLPDRRPCDDVLEFRGQRVTCTLRRGHDGNHEGHLDDGSRWVWPPRDPEAH